MRTFDIDYMANVVTNGAKLPVIPEVCGPLVYEGDLAFLFGPPNVGKTPFAFCIAEQFSGGATMIPQLRCETNVHFSQVFDFELSERQQGNRYRAQDGISAYQFSPKLLRAAFGGGTIMPSKNYTSEVVDAIAKYVKELETRLVILDNITALGAQGEKAFDACNLVAMIKTKIVRATGATVIIIAHTPKLNPATPLTMDAMAGSAAFRNLADSVFSIAGSIHGPRTRRIQQHKSRNNPNGSLQYGSENNLILESVKRPDGFITFDYVGESPESEHLPRAEERSDRHAEIMEAIRSFPNESDRGIAAKLGLNASSGHKMVGRVRRSSGIRSNVPSLPNTSNDTEQRWWNA